ncbi:MAG: hypothetical protein OXE99_04860 [Cellvibrionales bacterium]|nr:hypothetical protein [Cellvibrionales bacterium]
MDKTLTLGHVVAALSFLCAGVVVYSTTTNGIQRNEQAIAHLEQRLNSQAEQVKLVRDEFQDEIELLRKDFNSEIKIVQAKLDRLIERELNR